MLKVTENDGKKKLRNEISMTDSNHSGIKPKSKLLENLPCYRQTFLAFYHRFVRIIIKL